MKREEYLRMINFGALLSNTSNFLYTYILIALLIFAGLYFTVRTRGVQFRLFPEALRVLGEKKKDGKDISSFQALMISTASRVGTGNIAGVANAIIAATVIGGYGAVFWMWLLALIGAASAFIESTLAQCYKEKHGDNWVGGPAYYIQKALGSRFFGVVFAVLLIACGRISAPCSAACTFHTRLISNLLQVLAEKNLSLAGKLGHLSGRTIRERLLSYLEEQAARTGRATVTVPFDRQALADYLCVDRSALSRTIGALQREGVLTVRRDRFTLNF